MCEPIRSYSALGHYVDRTVNLWTQSTQRSCRWPRSSPDLSPPAEAAHSCTDPMSPPTSPGLGVVPGTQLVLSKHFWNEWITWMHFFCEELDSTGIPCFSKVQFMLHHFYERPMLTPVFTSWKKSRQFSLLGKKTKIAFSVGFADTIVEKAVPWVMGVPPPSSFPQNHIQLLRIQLPELWSGSEHLCFISIYFVSLLVRCVLR